MPVPTLLLLSVMVDHCHAMILGATGNVHVSMGEGGRRDVPN